MSSASCSSDDHSTPQWVTIIGGCDAWTLEQSVRFFGEAQEVAARMNIACSFETHRSRSLFNPWTTLAILQRMPELKLTCDFSHWVVVMERQLDDDWDVGQRSCAPCPSYSCPCRL